MTRHPQHNILLFPFLFTLFCYKGVWSLKVQLCSSELWREYSREPSHANVNIPYAQGSLAASARPLQGLHILLIPFLFTLFILKLLYEVYIARYAYIPQLCNQYPAQPLQGLDRAYKSLLHHFSPRWWTLAADKLCNYGGVPIDGCGDYKYQRIDVKR